MEPELPSDAAPDRDPSAAASQAPPADVQFEVPSLLPLWLILGAWALFWSALALWPALQQGASWSSRYDWRYFETMSELARRTVLWYHELPLWNPYSCGGEVGLANPQSLEAAPTFVLVLLFGTPWGFKLSMLVYLALGIFGTALLAKRLDMGWTGAVVAGTSFGLSGYMALHLSVGHINFAGVSLLPLLLYCFLRTVNEWRWLIWSGAVAGWIACLGGTFTPAMAGELLVMWATALAFRPLRYESRYGSQLRAGLRLYVMLLAVALAALCLSAFRMLPTLEFIFDHPRPLFRRAPDMTTLKQIVFDLFAWRDFGPLAQRKYWSHEYTARMPNVILPLLVAPIAAWLLREGRAREGRPTLIGRLVALATISLLLALGNFSALSPWSLLQKMPVLRDLRVPSRHLVLAVLWLSLLGGLGADWMMSQLRRRTAKRLPPFLLASTLCLVTAIDAVLFMQHSFAGVFTVGLVLPSEPVPFFHVQGHWSQMRELEMQGHGVMGCDEEAPLQRAEKLVLGDVPQAWLADPATGRLLQSHYTPNRRELTIETLQPGARLLLNSNWNEHWHALPKTVQVVKDHGQLALDLSALPLGQHRVAAYYRPRSFLLGVLLSALSWLIGLLWWRRSR